MAGVVDEISAIAIWQCETQDPHFFFSPNFADDVVLPSWPFALKIGLDVVCTPNLPNASSVDASLCCPDVFGLLACDECDSAHGSFAATAMLCSGNTVIVMTRISLVTQCAMSLRGG